MVNDCIEGNVDVITLITADSDQVSTIKYIKINFHILRLKSTFLLIENQMRFEVWWVQ